MAYLVPVLGDNFFFDDVLGEMNREMARMHQDMRRDMNRITPRNLLAGTEALQQQLEKIRDPVVTKDDGSRELNLRFDVGGFKPEEIKVKSKSGTVEVEAKHEEKTDNSRVFHHFTRHCTLPKGVDEDKLTSSLSKDGVLVVKAPMAPLAIEQGKKVPVLKEK